MAVAVAVVLVLGAAGAAGAAGATLPATPGALPGPKGGDPAGFKARRFTVAATGDFLLHTAVQSAALDAGGGATYEFRGMFADVAPEVRGASWALCHQETPLSADNTDLSGYPVFNAPREIAVAAADAGYDACSTASNHTLDRGWEGVFETLDVLDEAGIGHAGSARNAEEATNPRIYDVADLGGGVVRLGHLSYAYGFEGLEPPAEAPWLANVIDGDRILDDAARLRARGAEVVVVSLHWGAEYQRDPTPEQRDLAARLLASPDVDLLIGTHVHVVQPVEYVDGKLVAYGLGNLLSNQTQRPATQDGVILHLAFAERPEGGFAVEAVRYTPTWVEHPGFVIRRVSPESHPESFARTREALEALGVEGLVATTAP